MDITIANSLKAVRLLRFRASRSEPRVKNDLAIEVFTVTIGENRYISNFRSVRGSQASRRIGLVALGTKELIHFPSNLRIEFIEVAFRRSGLAGVRFLCTGNHKSFWVGQSERHDIVRGVLRVPQNSDKYNIIVGVDVCSSRLLLFMLHPANEIQAFKIVFLSFVEKCDTFLATRDNTGETN